MKTLAALPFILAISQLMIAQSNQERSDFQPQGNPRNRVYYPTTIQNSTIKSVTYISDSPRPVTTGGEIYSVQSNQADPAHRLPARSFYQSRNDWRHIIDSTWGPGEPLETKLAIFDSYADALSKKFDGFQSLGLNWNSWDSLKNEFRSRIDSTTSRGIFSSIMSQFAMSLRDYHTRAWDSAVVFTALTPGVPLLMLLPFGQAEHFGAVLTMLPDSTALVLRTVPDHPLDLHPGDVVLGYEGVPWKQLVRELLEAQLPVLASGVGSVSAEIHSYIRNAGNNWHLFSTIDILKQSSHDTVHISVEPLLNLPSDPIMDNEQMDIPGIPTSFFRDWPYETSGQLLTSGRIQSANVGYIRLMGEWPIDAADAPFASAVDTLWNGAGLIIDLRWNNGGWAKFDKAFAKMFSQPVYTLNPAYRYDPANFVLTPWVNDLRFYIPGTRGSIYDRPIAVLLGPTCVSDGDVMAQRLRYHPMVRFFGKAPIASMGFNEGLTNFPGWWLNYSIADAYHSSQPGVYLNRSEFPVDEPVWFNPDDVAKGIDPVLEKALRWISSISYAHGTVLSEDTVWHASDSIRITAKVENPWNHELIVSAIVSNGKGSTIDSLILMPASGDSLRGAYIMAPGTVGRYFISLRTDDLTSGSYRKLPDVALFIKMTHLNISSYKESPEIVIYPNPTDGIINIEMNMPDDALIEIYNTNGSIIYSKEAETNHETIDISGFPGGVYFVKVKQQRALKVEKVVVN